MDAKCVSWDQSPLWGDAGTDQVPDRIACQLQYYLDATGLPWGDVAALAIALRGAVGRRAAAPRGFERSLLMARLADVYRKALAA